MTANVGRDTESVSTTVDGRLVTSSLKVNKSYNLVENKQNLITLLEINKSYNLDESNTNLITSLKGNKSYNLAENKQIL